MAPYIHFCSTRGDREAIQPYLFHEGTDKAVRSGLLIMEQGFFTMLRYALKVSYDVRIKLDNGDLKISVMRQL